MDNGTVIDITKSTDSPDYAVDSNLNSNNKLCAITTETETNNCHIISADIHNNDSEISSDKGTNLISNDTVDFVNRKYKTNRASHKIHAKRKVSMLIHRHTL